MHMTMKSCSLISKENLQNISYNLNRSSIIYNFTIFHSQALIRKDTA